ncbi:hypothetical protein P691DRAFT_790778 [Macrolepiota fuliginosa MF-IS2]|uniref:CCHC-type domain-containing protein n=1 Tax=Macrolepiota fuliginosa MF-IS2 TaxID=1400762 RepID=A0A9P5XFV4_9AGAR|nr:hypothetical protein P691DRAFT_790778 [Macrolepiota fuliginosa MF-IS2]
MAARLARTPRLTLFSGPNCSLCDIAKAELTKVRQRRPFQLETINIQDKGQEQWKKKYVYWIPALHLEGKEIAKVVSGAATAANGGHTQAIVTAPTSSDSLFFVDTSGVINPWYESYMCGIYQRHTDTLLGEEGSDGGEEEPLVDSANLCFNCGSPDHSVPECPFRRDRELISLSRQYFNFYKELRGIVNHPRIYLAEGWRQQRLEWLGTFQPGQIKGPLLREAIGFGDGDWLKNMATWGYPPGWVSALDPREKVLAKIWDEHLDEGYERSDESFYIFGDPGEVEDTSESVLTSQNSADVQSKNENYLADQESLGDPPQTPIPIRWASYPSTYFSSELLFAYTRQEAPPSSSFEWNAAFESEDDYFSQLYAQPPPPPLGEPPPTPPPPPDEPPPPIPPPPLSSPPPPLPPLSNPAPPRSVIPSPSGPPLEPNGYLSPTAQRIPPTAEPDTTTTGEDEDMDISDSE